MPALPDYPLRLDAALAGVTDLRMTALARPFNLSGHPCLVIPFEAEGYPVGIQLVGRKDADEEVFLLPVNCCGVAHPKNSMNILSDRGVEPHV